MPRSSNRPISRPQFWQSLGVQLAAITTGCLALSMITFGIMAAEKQYQLAEKNIRREAQILATNITTSAVHHLVIMDLAELESLILKSARFINVSAIQILDAAGNVLSEARHNPGEPTRPVYRKQTVKAPQEIKPQELLTENVLTIWHPIYIVKHRGWVKLEYRLHNLEQIRSAIWRNTGIALMVAICLSVFTLVILLRPYNRMISKAAQFAANLDTLKGQGFDEHPPSKELAQLADALQHISMKLHEQETLRSQAELALFEEKERAQVTLHSIGDAVITTDINGRVEYQNPVSERLTGWSLEASRGQPIEKVFEIINEETREHATNPVARCRKEGRIVGLANHTILISRAGKEYAIQDSAAPIRGNKGEILGVVLVFSNVTESRRLSQELEYQASHDTLTDLPNRAEFERRLRRVLETTRTLPTENALCFLDLDRFKLVNDTSGHFAGDELLRQISGLLKDNVRKRDTLARLGGDEFGLLMEHCSVNEAMEVALKLTKVVADFGFSWEDKLFNIGVSIGLIAVDESAKSIDDLLSSADAACYMAKEQGRDCVHLYEVDDEELMKRHGEMQWAARLPQAIKDERLCLYYQPIETAAMISSEQAHYELLIRMKDEADNIIPPGAFLPAAERYNLSGRIDRWVIDTAFRQLIHHPEQLENLFLCAINLSGHSLSDETFLRFVRQKFEEFPIPAEKICFEITETVAIANLTRATALINELKAHGCYFALDDFGSGLSSFAYLKSLPVDFLKIDGAFVRDILRDPMDLAMVKSINEIGKAMGKRTIAEFVETEAILKKLQTIDVDFAQGYFIGQPRPFTEWLQPHSTPKGEKINSFLSHDCA